MTNTATAERTPTWEMFNLLTKSEKYGGYCVVALRCRDNKLVRLISSDTKTHGAIDKNTFTRRGYTMKPTDLIRVPIYGKSISYHQPENYMVHEKYMWDVEASTRQEFVLEKCPIQHTGMIFGTKSHCLSEGQMPDHSIEMVEVQNLKLYYPHEYSKRPKAKFLYNGIQYSNMSVTDPDFNFSSLDPSYFVDTPDGLCLRRAVLVVSLPNCPFDKDGLYYIFVARIFALPPQD